MKAISGWASRHTYLAIGLLVGCEIVNACNGILIGANALEYWPTTLVAGLMGLLIGGVMGLRRWVPPRFHRLRYHRQRLVLLAAFGANFLLFVGLGGLWGQAVSYPTSERVALASRSVRPRPDTLLPASAGVSSGTLVTQPTAAPAKPANDTGKRVLYAFLFLLGLGAMFFSAALACHIACAGHGFAALLVLALGTGFMAGGIYFISRGLERPILPLRELQPAQQRRIRGRFWKAWLLLIGLLGLLFLLAFIK